MKSKNQTDNIETSVFSNRVREVTGALFYTGYFILKYSANFSCWLATSVLKVLTDPSPMTDKERLKTYTIKKNKLLKQFQGAVKTKEQIGLGGKSVSYLFRPRQQTSKKIYMAHFNQVISVDTSSNLAHVEGMTTFYDLTEKTLKYGLIPKVIPELRGITIGGAICGLAIESSSFKYGLFHQSVTEMEVITGEGSIRVCRRDNDYSDLFYGMPNSFGTFGYVLSATVELVPATPFVKLSHCKFDNTKDFFQTMEQYCVKEKDNYDFIDGAIFSSNSMVMTLGKFVENAPYTSNYREMGIYYKSMQERDYDYLSAMDYIWRWDADSFWSTEVNGKPTILQNPRVRQVLGRMILRADRLRMFSKLLEEFNKNVLEPLCGSSKTVQKEALIQDVGIPIHQCEAFVDWLKTNIAIYPLFICPTESPEHSEKYPLWELNDGHLACDVGIFGARRTEYNPKEGHYNREVERKVEALGGKKSLYSQSFFTQKTFERLYYGGDAYKKLKDKYDSQNIFPTLYEKCVRNA